MKRLLALIIHDKESNNFDCKYFTHDAQYNFYPVYLVSNQMINLCSKQKWATKYRDSLKLIRYTLSKRRTESGSERWSFANKGFCGAAFSMLISFALF